MKKSFNGHLIFCFALGILVFSGASAQKPGVYSPSKTVQPQPPVTITDAAGYRAPDSVEEKLVALALVGPLFSAADRQNKINEYTLKNARNSWLNLLTLSLNFNELEFAGKSANPTSQYVYPKYFFGLNIPLGTVFSRTQVKAAREQVQIGADNKMQLSRNTRADVLEKYRQYKTKKELLKLQIQIADDEQAAFLQVEKTYRDGTVPLEAHIAAQKKYNDELVKKMNLQYELDVAKFEVEKLIGTNLESVTN
jgi:outer membrane protein TolC